VVVGRSNIVGKPIANILLQKQKGANATVRSAIPVQRIWLSIRRGRTSSSSLRKPKAITADMVKEGAVVIDVGVNRIGMTPEGKAKLCGMSILMNQGKSRRHHPVPGGVGPMTITMLMMNT